MTDIHEISDPAFVYCLRWLLETVPAQGKFAHKFYETISNGEIEPELILELCSGKLYQKCAATILADRTLENQDSTWKFIDVLIDRKVLQFNVGLADAVQDMLTDSEPFYEAVHQSVIEALMFLSVEKVSLETVQQEIKRFADFNPTRDSPYDLEDALLIWLNRVYRNVLVSETSTNILSLLQINDCDETDEVDDLLKAVDDGKIMLALLINYRPATLENYLRNSPKEIDDSTDLNHIFYEVIESQENMRLPCDLDDFQNCSQKPSCKKIVMLFLCQCFERLVLSKNQGAESCLNEAAVEEIGAPNEVQAPASEVSSPVQPKMPTTESPLNEISKTTPSTPSKLDGILLEIKTIADECEQSSEDDEDYFIDDLLDCYLSADTENAAGGTENEQSNQEEFMDNSEHKKTIEQTGTSHSLPVEEASQEDDTDSESAIPDGRPLSSASLKNHDVAQTYSRSSTPMKRQNEIKSRTSSRPASSLALVSKKSPPAVPPRSHRPISAPSPTEIHKKNHEEMIPLTNVISFSLSAMIETQSKMEVQIPEPQIRKSNRIATAPINPSKTETPSINQKSLSFTVALDDDAEQLGQDSVDHEEIDEDERQWRQKREKVMQKLEARRHFRDLEISAKRSKSPNRSESPNLQTSPSSPSTNLTNSSQSPKKRTPKKPPTITSSNKALVRNALLHLLGGQLYENQRKESILALDHCQTDHCCILLRGPKSHTYRALYCYHSDIDVLVKLHGQGPDQLNPQLDVSQYLKYDSSSHLFRLVPARAFSSTMHAMCLQKIDLTG